MNINLHGYLCNWLISRIGHIGRIVINYLAYAAYPAYSYTPLPYCRTSRPVVADNANIEPDSARAATGGKSLQRSCRCLERAGITLQRNNNKYYSKVNSSCRPREILPAANPAQQRMIIGNIDSEIRRKLPFSAKAFHNIEQLGIISITESDNEFFFF